MKSIRSALVLRVWLTFLGLLLVAGFALRIALRNSLTNEFDAAQLAKARTIATLVVEHGGSIEFGFADEIMPEFSRVKHPEYFELRLRDGTVFERSLSLGEKDLALPTPSTTTSSSWNMPLPDGRAGRAIALAFVPQHGDEKAEDAGESRPASDARSSMVLVLARSRDAIDRVMASITLWVVVSGAVLALVSALLVRITVASGLRPLGRFSEAVQSLQLSCLKIDELSTPLPAEMEPVRTRLVETLQRLGDAFEREKRFTAAAAHELRTPIAELKSMAQYALKWPEDAASARSTNQDILALALRMERLVTTMLAIARTEGSQASLRREPIELEALVKALCQPLDERSRARGLTWELSIPAELTVISDRAMLDTLLSNLLENAVEHALGGTLIRVEAEETPGSLGLSIANACDGFGPNDVAHAFEPFWRRFPGGSGVTHVGLGLTLALAAARALSAELRIDVVEGSTFIVHCRVSGSFRRNVLEPPRVSGARR